MFFNKTFLTTGMSIGNGGFFGYKLSLSNITVPNVLPPQIADIVPRDVNTNSPSVAISLKNLFVKLLVDYSVSVSAYQIKELRTLLSSLSMG
jgi:hypothetical protein